MQKNKQKQFIYRTTIWKIIGGGFSNPGQKKVFKIGRHSILLVRSEKLNKYGNPIHTATYIYPDGRVGYSYKSTGSATTIVAEAFRKNGIDVR